MSLREIIPTIHGMIQMGLRVNAGGRQAMIEVNLTTNGTHIPSVILKICSDGILQKPSMTHLRSCIVPPTMKNQIMVKETLPVMAS